MSLAERREWSLTQFRELGPDEIQETAERLSLRILGNFKGQLPRFPIYRLDIAGNVILVKGTFERDGESVSVDYSAVDKDYNPHLEFAVEGKTGTRFELVLNGSSNPSAREIELDGKISSGNSFHFRNSNLVEGILEEIYFSDIREDSTRVRVA